MRLSLRGKKIIVNQILLSELWYIGQIYTIPKYIKKETERTYNFLWNRKKIRPPRHLGQLSILRVGLGILDIVAQLKSLKIKWIQRLLNLTNALWKDLMLYRLNLILNSNQGLALFKQKQILSSNRNKNLQKQNNQDFFIQLLNVWLHFTNNNFPTPTSIKEILDQPIFLNPHTKLDFISDNQHFHCIPPRNILDKFTIIRDLCRFLQPGLICSTTFDKKLGFPTSNHKRIYKLIMDLIPNDSKHLLRTETFQKTLLKIFYYNNKGTRKENVLHRSI